MKPPTLEQIDRGLALASLSDEAAAEIAAEDVTDDLHGDDCQCVRCRRDEDDK